MKVCIVYTQHPDILRTAFIVKKVLNDRGVQTTIKPAEEARIPDLTPVDLMLLGAEDGLSLANSAYRELFRSFQGVNFAGRRGAFFSTSPAGIEALRRMVQDSELEVVRPPLVVRNDTGEKTIEAWLQAMLF